MSNWCFRVVSGSLVCLSAATAMAQSVNLIEEQLTDVRRGFFELGPFHATPVFRFSTGYDSNALSTPDPQEDIRAMFGPGIRLGLPMGSSAFFDFYQEIDFVYYREQTDLRQVFNITRVGGGWGGRRFLLRVDDEFRDETMRPTTEFDFPVPIRTNRFDTSLTMALGWRQKLRASYVQRRREIRDQPLEDATVAERLNEVREMVSVDLRRNVTAKTEAIIEGFYEDIHVDDVTRSSTSYGGRFGFDFSPAVASTLVPTADSTGIAGELLLGFRKLIPVDMDRVDYTGLIGKADVSFTSAGRHRIRGVYERDIMPSVLDENWYFVQNRAGAFFRWQVHQRFSIEPGATLGRNDYPLPRMVETDDGEVLEKEILDEHTTFSLALEYQLRESWFIGATTSYLDRRSNLHAFDKSRLLVSFDFVLRP